VGLGEKVIEFFNSKQMIRWAIVAAIFLFLGKMVWDNWNQVRDASFTLQGLPLILSTLLFTFSYFIQIGAWYLITRRLNIALSPSETLGSWFTSQLGKYLPGKIWLLLSRFYFYQSKGKSKKNIIVALYLETVTMIVAAAILFLLVLILHREFWLFSWSGGWLILLCLLGLALLHPTILQKTLNWLLVKWKREPVSLSISYSQILWILCVCILSWVAGGIGFYLFVASIHPVMPNSILFLIGALAASSMLGLIAIFAPSGLGVREGALVYLLSFLMATPIAVVISVLTRIWMTLIEIGMIAVIYLFGKFQRSS
jgi:uncharacterized membrane protein YbhN (UPF0104 family)